MTVDIFFFHPLHFKFSVYDLAHRSPKLGKTIHRRGSRYKNRKMLAATFWMPELWRWKLSRILAPVHTTCLFYANESHHSTAGCQVHLSAWQGGMTLRVYDHHHAGEILLLTDYLWVQVSQSSVTYPGLPGWLNHKVARSLLHLLWEGVTCYTQVLS